MKLKLIALSVSKTNRNPRIPNSNRHNSKEYIEKAQSLMKTFSSYLFHENYCVRFGISIIPADLKGSSSSCQCNRVGAFEIQIAYKSPLSKSVEIDILYSKLQTRRWPSKSVVEKRLEAFCNKHHIATMKASSTSNRYYSIN
jgi:hypothetical protein